MADDEEKEKEKKQKELEQQELERQQIAEQEQLEAKQKESWRNELVPDARAKYKEKSEVKDIDKKKHASYFVRLKRVMAETKKVIPDAAKDMAKYKNELKKTVQKIKEATLAAMKGKSYKASVVAEGAAKLVISFLKSCSKEAKRDFSKLTNIVSSGMRSSYNVLVGYYINVKTIDLNVKARDKNPGDKKKENAEDKAYWEKVRAGLEKTETSRKKIEQERKALKKLVDEAENGQSSKKKIIDVQWAKEQIKEYKAVEKVALVKINGFKGLLDSKVKGAIPQAMRLEPKARQYKELSGGGKSGSNLEKGQKKPEEKKADEPKADKDKDAKAKEQAKEQQNAAPAVAEVGLAKPENAKLKEVAKGVSEQVMVQAVAGERVGVKTAELAKEQQIGISRQAKKEQLKENARQEREYKKLEISAERTLSNGNQQEVTQTEQREQNETQQVQKSNDETKKTEDSRQAIKASNEARQTEMVSKIDNLRSKLENLQEKRSNEAQTANNMAQNSTARNNEAGANIASEKSPVELSKKEIQAMPSVKAEMSLSKAETSLELPAVEKGAGVTEASLHKMEEATQKAESSVKTMTFVPDYASAEFKQKAAENGIALNQSSKEQDMNKLKTLSGRTSENVSQNQNGEQNQQQPQEQQGPQNQSEQGQSQNRQLSIDPEKSKSMSAENSKTTNAENSGKQINMQTYQMMKHMRGGKATG